MKTALLTTFTLLILLVPLATAIPITPIQRTPYDSTTAQTTNVTTQAFVMVRVLLPATSNLKLVNNGSLSESGFASPLNINFGYGHVAGAKLMVENGTLAVEPLTHAPITLNPGDNITVLFGLFHFLIYSPPDKTPRGFLIGRFFGVVIEKHD
jgi:hypothetical protein